MINLFEVHSLYTYIVSKYPINLIDLIQIKLLHMFCLYHHHHYDHHHIVKKKNPSLINEQIIKILSILYFKFAFKSIHLQTVIKKLSYDIDPHINYSSPHTYITYKHIMISFIVWTFLFYVFCFYFCSVYSHLIFRFVPLFVPFYFVCLLRFVSIFSVYIPINCFLYFNTFHRSFALKS